MAIFKLELRSSPVALVSPSSSEKRDMVVSLLRFPKALISSSLGFLGFLGDGSALMLLLMFGLGHPVVAGVEQGMTLMVAALEIATTS